MKKMAQMTKLLAGLAIGGLLPAGLAWAQVAPDAGTNLDMLRKAPQPLPQGPAVTMPERMEKQWLGGQSVQIREISLQGNTQRDTALVLSSVQAETAIAQPLNLDGLRSLADRITDYYRSQGFPFARAFLPVQELRDGKLVIQVVEGQYGRVEAKSSDAALALTAQQFLEILGHGDTIASGPLERATLLISDLPGVSIVPVMKPGVRTGDGNLDVFVEQEQRTAASVSIDNFGSRYTGSTRVQFNGALNAAFTPGDQLAFTGIAPVQGLWVGSLNYALPLGSNGTRAQAGFSRLQYKLQEDFEGFYGQADVYSLTISYPIVRSRTLNVGASVAYQHKDLSDSSGIQTVAKTAEILPLTVTFDQRDTLGGGGVTYGAATVESGNIASAGVSTAITKGTLDIARIQQLGDGWNLYGHWFQQITSDNLDSSEKLVLGGATGVRAYPSGEAAGDSGYLVQAELRTTFGAWSPYVFYDYGKVKVDARPELVSVPSPDKTRAGSGVGLRYVDRTFSWNAALAWAQEGGTAEADAKTPGNPRVWVEARYAF